MGFPKGLQFRKRCAEADGRIFFDCTRAGHPPGQKRVKREFRNRRDREQYITRHDAKYHDELLAARLGIDRGPSLGEVVGDFMQHMRKLTADGKRDHKTVSYYKGLCDNLIGHFGSTAPVDSIGRRAILSYAKAQVEGGSTSEGARFVKAAKVVKRLQRFAGLTVVWEIPTDDISPVHRERVSIPIEDIRDFLRAMPADSLERAFAMTKFVTMLRNEELYAATVGDVNLEAHTLDYTLRNKQTGAKMRHVTNLPPVLITLLSGMLGRKPDAPLFTIDGQRLGPWSLRKRFLRASKIATEARRKVDPEAKAVVITAIGQFRHEAATIAMNELESVKAVADHLDHKDERTTRGKYKLRKRDATLAQSQRVTETTAGKLVN